MDSRELREPIEILRELEVGKHFNHYRPEQHYMRGPGPKWHAKHEDLPLRSHDDEHHGTLLALWLVPAVAIALLGFMAAVALT